MKRKFILLTLVIATLIVPANLQAFESTVEEELQTPWEGFGYNQWGFARESDGNTFKPWSDDLWKTTTERILAIKPSLVRLPVIRDWADIHRVRHSSSGVHPGQTILFFHLG